MALAHRFYSLMATQSVMSEESFPAHEALRVVKGRTIYKTDRWWKAILLTEAFGRRQVSVYLWQNRNGVWKRKQKYTVRSASDWLMDKTVIDELVKEL